MTKTSIIFIAAASVAALTTTSVLAQDRMMRGERFLKRADVNNDGKLTVDEVVNQATARFDKTDSNNDGEISVEEMADRIQRERDERRAARADDVDTLVISVTTMSVSERSNGSNSNSTLRTGTVRS